MKTRITEASPPMDALSTLPGYALRRASNAMMGALAQRLATIHLRVSDSTVLQLVADRTDMTSTEIGKILDIQRANMVPLLNRLESSGLIRRVPLDRKSQAVVLTDAGIDRLAEVREITQKFETDLMARIPVEHRAHFLPSLQALML